MLDEVMMSAIQLNRVDFVELFLDNGVSLKDFLTIKRLIMLYNNVRSVVINLIISVYFLKLFLLIKSSGCFVQNTFHMVLDSKNKTKNIFI